MRNKKIHREEPGTITVFLSLILILILSLICTIIEGARVSTAKVISERAMTSAVDSVLAEYYGPLWEEYHIFGYYTGGGTEAEQEDRLADLVLDYMSYTFEPDKDSGSNSGKDGIELYDITPGSVTADNGVSLMGYDGKLLINEAVEYMKYREVGDVLEKLLGKLSLLEEPGKVSYIMEEKQKAEEELVEIDKEILKLMELYDGLKTSSKGIKLDKDGSLMIADPFIKKICYGAVTSENVGINQDSIFLAQKDNYVNPDDYFNAIDENLSIIVRIYFEIDTLQSEIDLAEADLTNQQAALNELNSIDKKTDDDKQKIKDAEAAISSLEASIKEKEDQINKLKEMIESLVSSVKKKSDFIIQLIQGIQPLINPALSSLDNIIAKLKTAAPLLKQYEETLKSQKDTLSQDIYEGLEEDLKELKKYTEDGVGGYDFTGMKGILEYDSYILAAAKGAMDMAEGEFLTEDYSYARAYYSYAGGLLKSYRIDGLTLDYSTLVYDKSKQKAPLDEVNNIIKDGLMSLVLDPEKISDSELKASDILPSEIYAMSQDKTDYGSALTSFFKSAVVGDTNSGMGSLFGSFGDSTQTGDLLSDVADILAEQLLFREYLAENFERYPTQEQDIEAQKPSVLAYEQEYLLAGQTSDRENMASIISRLIFIRMIFDFVSVISDSAIRNEAKLTAAALVGFTGLPILVSITQILILLLWSFAEALLDVNALMLGKEMPILKKNVVLTFPEIFLLNRAYLQQKAKSLTDTKEPSLSYRDYLRIFLLMKSKSELAYRSMDLMQENIKIRYDTGGFEIKNCLFGFDAKAEILIGTKFISFSFLKNYLRDPIGYRYIIKTSCSY